MDAARGEIDKLARSEPRGEATTSEDQVGGGRTRNNRTTRRNFEKKKKKKKKKKKWKKKKKKKNTKIIEKERVEPWWEEREREKAAVVFLGRLGKIRTRRTNGLTKVAKVGDIQSRGHVLHERTPRAGRWSSHDSVLFFFVPFCPTLPPSSSLPFFIRTTGAQRRPASSTRLP